MGKEPVFGPNAKAFAIQALIAIVALTLANIFLRPWLERVIPPLTRSIFALFE